MATPNNANKAVNKVGENAKTTGHAWDGIEEYNNPLPRWWVWVFLACIVFALGYVCYYPAFPTRHTTVSGWTSLKQLEQTQVAAAKQNEAMEARIASADVQSIQDDETLRSYAMASGKALFSLNCSQCHGSGAGGTKGFPNLLDDEWVHGGTLSEIHFTITHGVRNTTDPEARNPGNMPAFGDTEMLPRESIEDVVNYLSVLAYKLPGNESTTRGATVFAENCASCHGEGGVGMKEMGAPALNNAIWQFGKEREDRIATLMHGRAGVMPAWGQVLNTNDVKKVAVYVFNLGGGVAEEVSATVPEATSATTAPVATPAETPAAASPAAPEASPTVGL